MENNGNWKEEKEVNWMEMEGEGETFKYDVALAIKNKVLPWDKRNLYGSMGDIVNNIKISDYIKEVITSNSSPNKKEKECSIFVGNEYAKNYIEKVYAPKFEISYCLYNNEPRNDCIIGMFDSPLDLVKYLGTTEDWYWGLFSNNEIKKEDIFFNVRANKNNKVVEATHSRLGVGSNIVKYNGHSRALKNLEIAEIRSLNIVIKN